MAVQWNNNGVVRLSKKDPAKGTVGKPTGSDSTPDGRPSTSPGTGTKIFGSKPRD